MSVYVLTSAPRSSVTHVHDMTTRLAHSTACGREIGEKWAGELDEGIPSGMPTCMVCLRNLGKSVPLPDVPADDDDDTASEPADEVAGWRDLRGHYVAAGRRYVRDAQTYRAAGYRPGVLLALRNAAQYRRAALSASASLAVVEAGEQPW